MLIFCSALLTLVCFAFIRVIAPDKFSFSRRADRLWLAVLCAGSLATAAQAALELASRPGKILGTVLFVASVPGRTARHALYVSHCGAGYSGCQDADSIGFSLEVNAAAAAANIAVLALLCVPLIEIWNLRRDARARADRLPLERRANGGAADAQFFLGDMYFCGKGVARDSAAAAVWFRHAADRGHRQAQSILAGLLLAGEGVAPDAEEAYFWLLIAHGMGQPLPAEGTAQLLAATQLAVSQLSPDQLQQARMRAQLWQPLPATPVMPPEG